MKASTKSLRIPVLLAGVLCLLFSPVVLYYSTLDELDDINPAAFQNVDIDASGAVSDQAEKIIESAFIFAQALRNSPIFPLQLPSLFFDLSSPNSMPLVLRC